MAEFRSEKSEMSDVAFAQDVMRGFVATRPGENTKHRLTSAARALRWSYSRAKSVLYGEARIIKATEMDQLCKAAKVQREVRKIADDHEQLTERLARMEAMLASLMARMDGGSADQRR